MSTVAECDEAFAYEGFHDYWVTYKGKDYMTTATAMLG